MAYSRRLETYGQIPIALSAGPVESIGFQIDLSVPATAEVKARDLFQFEVPRCKAIRHCVDREGRSSQVAQGEERFCPVGKSVPCGGIDVPIGANIISLEFNGSLASIWICARNQPNVGGRLDVVPGVSTF